MINNILQYNDRMAKSLNEKLFFLNSVEPNELLE